MTYTVTRKKDRAEMAHLLTELVVQKGATCATEPNLGGSRGFTVKIKAARGLSVSVDFYGDSGQPNAYVLSWYIGVGHTAKLQADFAPSVNSHHFRKATDIAYGFEELLTTIAYRLDSANSGEAFQSNRE